MDTWEETKKEYDINEKGEYIATHVTTEKVNKKILGFDRKDFWDQIIKSVGIIAIVIPLILFKCSRDADLDKQKNLLQLELFSNISSDIQTILLMSDTSTDFKNSKEKIDIDYYSKIMMLGNDSIIDIYKKLKDTISIYTLLIQMNNMQDSIVKFSNIIKNISSDAQNSLSFKDSALKIKSAVLESWAKQWMNHFKRMYSLEMENKESQSSTVQSLVSLVGFLNKNETSIRDSINVDTTQNMNLKAIEQNARDYNFNSLNSRTFLRSEEENYKKTIDSLFQQLKQMMKKTNKILK